MHSMIGALVLAPAVAFALAPPLTVQEPSYGTQAQKVPVVLGVMSRCPDALTCEAVFDRVLKQVGNKVDLSLSFIGT
jgi:hypothetical protein